MVAWAGVLPDLDGLTLLAYPFDQGEAYSRYHHLLTHSIWAALVVSALFAWLAQKGQRTRVLMLAFLAFHLHLLCDLLGSGRFWPIFYFYPLNDTMISPFSFGWELNGWQNQVIGLVTIATILVLSPRLGRTFFEMISAKWDAIAVGVFRKWAGMKTQA